MAHPLDPGLERDQDAAHARHQDAAAGNQELGEKRVKLRVVDSGQRLGKLSQDKLGGFLAHAAHAPLLYMALQMEMVRSKIPRVRAGSSSRVARGVMRSVTTILPSSIMRTVYSHSLVGSLM